MIKHIVMWRLKGETPSENRQARELVKAKFEELRTRIPGLRRLEVGADFSAIENACDLVLYTEFESPEALAAYAEHPEHLRIKRELGDIRIARFQVDYAVEGE
jgi:heme-degrading monooxygenase HmoA